MSKLLFLCTGNYYRSRFAEFYFRHVAEQRGLQWMVDSRGLALSANNVGHLSRYTLEACEELGVSVEPLRMPRSLSEEDLREAALIIAVKETEHRHLMQQCYPDWEHSIEYWEVHDVDCAPPEEALPVLRRHVERLIDVLLASPLATG